MKKVPNQSPEPALPGQKIERGETLSVIRELYLQLTR